MCLFGIHRWEKWQEIERGNILRRRCVAGVPMEEFHKTGIFVRQMRTCARCGKAETRTSESEDK